MDCQSDRVAGSRRRTGRRLLFVVALAATALALGRVSMKADGLGWAMFYRATEDPNFSFDYGYSIRPIPGGGFMMAGVTAYPGDPAITKLDANGNTIWTKAYRNTLSEDIYTQWLTDDGGVIAAGLVRRQPCCEMDMLVMKVASDGALQWSKTYALQGNERATHIQQVGSKYIVVGETFSSKEGTRAWVLTLRADGSVERQIAYGKKKKVNTAYYGLPLSDGGLLAVGTTTETGKSQSSELWLFKLNPDGSLAWQKAYPAKGSQNGVHLHPTPDGGAIVLSRGAPDDQWHLRNAWALKINAQGDTTGGGWQRAFGFPTAYAEVTGYSLHTLAHHTMPDGSPMETGYILAGTTHDSRGPRDGSKVFLAHLQPNGNFEWQRSYDLGSWGGESLHEVQMVGSDGFVVTGSMGGGIPPGFTPVQGFMQYAVQGFAIRVPMNGLLDPIGVPAGLQMRSTSIEPVATKAVGKATAATVSPYTFYQVDGMASGRVVTPVQ